MKVLQKIVGAWIVYRDYCSKKYFSVWNPLPLLAILYEYYRLKAEVAVVRNDQGDITGTIMMAQDRGPKSIPQLDDNFESTMKRLRMEFPPGLDGKTAIGFCGKLGTKGQKKSSSTALRCFLEVVEFASKNDLKVILCVVNPNHCSPYKKMGGHVVDSIPNMKGMKDAPGQLVKIVLADCPKIMRRLAQKKPDTNQPTLDGVAA